MFINLNKTLSEGETFKLTLDFEKAGQKTVDVVIAPIGGGQKKKHDKHHDHDHGAH